MKTHIFWKQLLIGCLFIALLAGCGPAVLETLSQTPTIKATKIAAATETSTPEPTQTIKPTITPLPFIEGSEFPTGIFEHVGGHWIIEYRDDGSGYWSSARPGTGDFWITYGVNGNLYSEMQVSYPIGRQVPATYYWTYDGEILTFQSWGKDLRPERWGYTHGQNYRFLHEVEPSPADEKIDFPTGKFMSENGLWTLEFGEDGTWQLFGDNLEQPVRSGKYVTTVKYYTEMTHDDPDLSKIPVTYTWTYDGQKLTFKLWGEDVIDRRQGVYDGQSYTLVEE